MTILELWFCANIFFFSTPSYLFIRHRSEETFKLNFGDTVKSGSDLEDIWRRILLEIKPCTESVANAIIAKYPSYRALIEAYQKVASVPGKEGLLEDIMVSCLSCFVFHSQIGGKLLF
jgi:hypothetical protein